MNRPITLLSTLLLLFFSLCAKAQNMVPNGDFEQYTTCPNNPAGSMPDGWHVYGGPVIYYNRCSSSPPYSVPLNTYGYQHPVSGNAYIGVHDYETPGGSDTLYKGYISRVISKLTIGVRYRVSMSANLSDYGHYTTHDLGAWFYEKNADTFRRSNVRTLPVTPQVLYSVRVIDTANWVRLSSSFIADSAYDHIVVGGFGDTDASTGVLPTSWYALSAFAFYFIDSVVVTPVKGIYLSFTDTTFCAGDSVIVPFTVIDSVLTYSSNNVFSLQLSDAYGSFSNSIVLDTVQNSRSDTFHFRVPLTITSGRGYRLRMLSSNFVDSSIDNGRNIAIGNVYPSKPIAGNDTTLCQGDSLRLNATTTTSGVAWLWTGPGNFFALAKDTGIAHIKPSGTGAYIVRASLYGCIAKDTVNVTVVQTDNVLAASSNISVCNNDTLKLTSSSSVTPFSYSWTGPNSFSSSAKDTSIVHPGILYSGNYISTAIITAGCITRDTVTVTIKPTVSNHNIISNAPICSGDTLKLLASTTDTGVSYYWSGPSFSSANKQSYIYNAPATASGSYIVSYTTGNGCFVFDTVNVVVNQSPSAITASSNTPVCEADTLQLHSTNSSAGVYWHWSGSGNYVSSAKDSFIAHVSLLAAGRYYVTATANNGCFVKDSVDVTIKPLPQNFSIISNNPQCQGNTLSMNGNTTNSGVTWAWSGPGSYSSTSSNISFANAQPSISGNYILAATLNGCTARDTLAARVIAIPAVPNPTANTPVCVGQTLSLNAGSTGPAYLWSGPNSFVSTSQTTAITNATTAVAGTYSVKVIDGGCISADGSVTVTVIPAPTAGMYPSPKDSICQGSPVTFNGFASNAGTGYTFRWFRNSLPISGATGTQYTDTHTADYDSYYCTVTSNGTCATPYIDTSNVVTMRVFPWLVPSVTITTTATGNEVGGDLISFTATPVNGGNYPGYQWKRNNKNELGALSYTWGARTLSDKDVVCVEMTSSYICPQPKTAMSNCIAVTVNTTGIENAEWVNGVRIYPNPVTDELRVEGISAGTEIRIIDILGRETGHMVAVAKTATIATTTWANGTYLLQLNGKDGKRMTATIVKQ